MHRDARTLDEVARRLVRDSEEDLRRFLGVAQLEPALVTSLYLHVRSVIERCDEESVVDELVLALYLSASAWQPAEELPVDLLAALHSVITRTLQTERSKGEAMKLMSWMLPVCLLLAPMALAAEDGAALFKSKCALCHGADGSGDTPMGKKLALKALGSESVQKLTDEQISQTIVKGKGKMPAFDKKLTPDQVRALVAHVRSLRK